MAEEVQKKRSPWVYVGIGCAAAIVLSCGTILIATVVGVNALKGWGEELADPTKRENKARKEAMASLGGIPDGYSAALSFGFPMVFDMLLFVDAPLLADGGVPQFNRQFIFMRLIETDRTAEMKAFFESSDGGTLKSDNLQVDSKGELGRGSFMHKSRKVSWVSMKGRVRNQTQFDKDEDSIITTMLFDCPDNGQVRIGTWQMREPEEGFTDPNGTVADQAEMQKLLSPLSPCGK
jgi:hypothetical protein